MPPAGEAREEWEVIDEIAKRIGIVPFSVKARAHARPPARPAPDAAPASPSCCCARARRATCSACGAAGLNIDEDRARAARHRPRPSTSPTGVLREKVRHPGSRVQLAPDEIAAEVARLSAVNGADPDFPLRLIGLRELRSHNSWMHNSPLLMRGGRAHALRVNPRDAEEHGLVDGGEARLASKSGSVVVPGEGDRRDDAGHGRAAARLGPQGRLERRERRGRREREPARELGARTTSSRSPGWRS